MTPEEKDAMMRRWADFVHTGGGGGDLLSLAMYEGLNDTDIRDAFLFWQIGGSPDYLTRSAPHRREVLNRLIKVAGTAPEPARAADALAVALNRLPRGSNATVLVDAGTVLVLASLLWDLLESRYSEAQLVMTELIDLNLAATKGRPTHYEPMRAFGEACKKLPQLNPADAHNIITKLFGIPVTQPGNVK